jgi:NAD(P)H-flavin reductase
VTDAANQTKQESTIVYFSGTAHECAPGETVLDALLRHNPDLAYSCRKGTCLSCILKADGPVPAAAQEGLQPTLVKQGYFLPCLCPPVDGMRVEAAEGDGLFLDARIESIEKLASHMTRVRLSPGAAFAYQAGQFINLRRSGGPTRSYSLASVPGRDDLLELHVKRLENGLMSNWLADAAGPGDGVEIQGPNGSCFYLEGNADGPLMLIGNGAGLAPLWGIARDALGQGHQGEIHLYHGSRHTEGLYLQDELRALAGEHVNFHYHPCLSGMGVPENCRRGRAEEVAFADHQDLKDWRLYLCGYPPMVEAARKTAFLKGAALKNILGDAFELRELRAKPRR